MRCHFHFNAPAVFIIGAVALLAGCASQQTTQQHRTVDEIYREAYTLFTNGDYVEALAEFDIIRLQYPASSHADDAQYYIGEINYERGDYVMAAYNYNVVRRSFPSSNHAKPSAFKVGLCYEELSLPADRDQEYTRKAIQAFNEFQQLYPTDSLSFSALEHIRSLRDKLAERYMLIAEHYVKTESRRAAITYYSAVTEEYPDSKYYEQALVLTIQLQSDLAKTDKCRASIAQYRNTVQNPTMEHIVNEIEKELP